MDPLYKNFSSPEACMLKRPSGQITLIDTVQYTLQELCNVPVKKWSLFTVLLRLGRTAWPSKPQCWRNSMTGPLSNRERCPESCGCHSSRCAPLPSSAGCQRANLEIIWLRSLKLNEGHQGRCVSHPAELWESVMIWLLLL